MFSPVAGNTFLWFLYAVLLLAVGFGVVLLLAFLGHVVRKNYDGFVDIFFKGAQMREHIKDRVWRRDMLGERQQYALESGLSIAGLPELDSDYSERQPLETEHRHYNC